MPGAGLCRDQTRHGERYSDDGKGCRQAPIIFDEDHRHRERERTGNEGEEATNCNQQGLGVGCLIEDPVPVSNWAPSGSRAMS